MLTDGEASGAGDRLLDIALRNSVAVAVGVEAFGIHTNTYDAILHSVCIPVARAVDAIDVAVFKAARLS